MPLLFIGNVRNSLCQASDGYIGRRAGYRIAPMSIITGEIDLCSCRDLIATHDAFGCSREGCECTQTQSQFEHQQAVLASLDFLYC